MISQTERLVRQASYIYTIKTFYCFIMAELILLLNYWAIATDISSASIIAKPLTPLHMNRNAKLNEQDQFQCRRPI